MIEKEIEFQAKRENKKILFYKNKQVAAYCSGCGRFDTKNFAKDLCRSCYANWMRQKKKWRERIDLDIKGTYKEKAKKYYGSNPHCNMCGKRQFIPNLFSRQTAKYPSPDTTIHIHHIDGNHKNNSLLNLEVLCCSCHKMKHLSLSTDIS